MKKIKLSLVASLAAGAFSFANAVALDEAIANVDFTGELRYRYDTSLKNLSNKNTKFNLNTNSQTHKYRANLKLTADIADNFKATALIRYGEVVDASYGESRFDKFAGDGELEKKGVYANTNETFKLREAYLTYTNNELNTSLSFGKMQIDSIWTDGVVANGVEINNTFLDGVTFKAFMYDNFDISDDDLLQSDSSFDPVLHNLYGAAVLFDSENVLAGFWLSYIKKIGVLYAADVSLRGGDESFGYSLQAQYAGSKIKEEEKKRADIANSNFLGLKASLNISGFDASLGYVNFGNKEKLSFQSLHDKGQFINAGEIAMNGYNGSGAKHEYYFLTLGYNCDKLRFGLDLVKGKTKQTTVLQNKKVLEITPRLSYKYSDKLEFNSFYAYSKTKENSGLKIIDKQIRFEAKYTF